MVRVGVIGVGHLGRHHARILRELPHVKLVGVHDQMLEKAEEVGRELNVRVFRTSSELLQAVDAASIAVPATYHRAVALPCFEQGKDVFLEKPLATSLEEADAMVRAASERGLILQVGHVERFNPAVRLAEKMVRDPRFIEGHRLGPFARRGTDVDVVVDLMIHDVDLVLHFVQSPVVRVEAVGVPVLSPTEDIANARIEFESGCIANLTGSRVSQKQVRKLRFFQSDSYVSVDCMKREVDLLRRTTEPREAFLVEPVGVTEIEVESGVHIQKSTYQCAEGNPLRDELSDFIDCVVKRRKPLIGGEGARESLRVALAIAAAIREKRGREKEAQGLERRV